MSCLPTYNGEYAGFLEAFARQIQALEKLMEMRTTASKRGHHLCNDALWEGIFALQKSMEDEIKEVQLRGQLLLAWAGSKALEGVAA